MVSSEKIALFEFKKNNIAVKNAPKCALTLKAAGYMRFSWSEKNENREKFIQEIEKSLEKNIVPVQLIHSKTVYICKNKDDLINKLGDGIITDNKKLMPSVTVADCVPIYLYDEVSGAFGIVHSGWKGTGIVAEAVSLMKSEYGTKPEDLCVVIGPHIRDCCYIVNQERADYFTEEFGAECVTPLEENGKCYCGGKGLPVQWDNGTGKLFRLSLEKANRMVLKKSGILDENINVISDCTCCLEKYGSNRRQTAFGEQFCVQAAFIFWE